MYTKKMLTNMFDMKQLGVADIILEIKIIMTSYGLVLFQSYFVEKILYKYFKYYNSTIKHQWT